jgi:hypothetical protein
MDLSTANVGRSEIQETFYECSPADENAVPSSQLSAGTSTDENANISCYVLDTCTHVYEVRYVIINYEQKCLISV